MKNTFSKIKNWVLRNKWWTALIVLVFVIILFVVFGDKKNTAVDFVIVQRHNLVEEVSATGNVKPFSDLDLSFETSGQVSHVSVLVGDRVYQGQYLASLSNADLAATVEQAKAGLKIAEANLSSLRHGSTPEQIAVNQAQVEKATSDLFNAKIGLINSIRDSFTKSDDAIRNYIDLLFNDPRSQNPTLQFQTDSQLQNNITSERVAIETMLTSWDIFNADLSAKSNFDSSLSTANNNLSSIRTLLQNLAFAVNKLSTDSSVSQTTITLWKSNVSIARTNIDLATSNLSTAFSQYQSALSALNIANSQLTLTKTGATNDQLQAQEAMVEQAQANVDAARANLSKSIIASPINGVITNVIAKVGQTMQPGITAISVISYGEYDVESYVPEADISKIKVGDIATTTLDAYGSNTFFETSVIKIDPAETILSGVPTYKVTLKFASSSDSRIKSGMTANLDISTGQKNDVLAIPSRIIYSKNSVKYVKLVDENYSITETSVTTGLRGVDGYIEITSGLKESDRIVNSINL